MFPSAVEIPVVVMPPGSEPPESEEGHHHEEEEDGGSTPSSVDAGSCSPACTGGYACTAVDAGACHAACVFSGKNNRFRPHERWNVVLDRVLLKGRGPIAMAVASPPSSTPNPDAPSNSGTSRILLFGVGVILFGVLVAATAARRQWGAVALLITVGVAVAGVVAYKSSGTRQDGETSEPSATTSAADAPSPASACDTELHGAEVCWGLRGSHTNCVTIADACDHDGGATVPIPITTEDLLQRPVTIEVRLGDRVVARRAGRLYPNGLQRQAALCRGAKLAGFVDDVHDGSAVDYMTFWIEPRDERSARRD